MLQIKVKYFDKDIKRLEKISIGDWIDLVCSEEVELKKGQQYYIPLGVAM